MNASNLNSPSTILIVDDELEMRRALKLLLAAEGYKLAFARNGAEALEKATEIIPDLILLDVKMPDTDGFTVCQHLRVDPVLAKVPVIMITSLGDRDSRLRGFEAGADDYVTKPIDEVELLIRIRTTTRLNRYRRLLAEQTRRRQAELGQDLAFAQASQAIHALQESEKQFRDLYENAPNAYFSVGVDGTIRRCNKRASELLGYKVEELIGQPVLELYTDTPQGKEKAARVFERFRAGETISDEHLQMKRADGTPVWISLTPNAVLDAHGQIVESRSMVVDITERVRSAIERAQAEEALRRRNEELAALNAIASAMSRSRDLDEVLNAALEETLTVLNVEGGLICLPDELGQCFSSVLHRGFSQAVLQEITEFGLGKGSPGRADRTGQLLLVPDLAEHPGTTAPITITEGWRSMASVPLNAKEQTIGVMIIASRVRSYFSSERADMLTTLGHQLGVAIENARLTKEASEIEILQELDRLRSELIANVSHELRTPLGLIKIYNTTLLAKDVELGEETQQECLQTIDQETDRLERIVDNLLDLSQLEGGQLYLDNRPADVGQLTKEIVQSIKVQATRHDFVLDLEHPLVAVIDSKRVEQVLRNLLSNAIKYSPQGGTITVQGHRNEGYVLVGIRDEGIGIPQKELGLIFERFYRVENEITQRVRGTGLGLSVCRGIVEAHGGRIWAESAPGEGSTLYFTLPIGQ